MHVAIVAAQFILVSVLVVAAACAFYVPGAMRVAPAQNNAPAGSAGAWRDILMAVFGLLLVAVVMSGCSAVSWTKAGASESEMARDRSECEYEAEKATPMASTGDALANGLESGMRKAQLRSMCLKLRGYREARG